MAPNLQAILKYSRHRPLGPNAIGTRDLPTKFGIHMIHYGAHHRCHSHMYIPCQAPGHDFHFDLKAVRCTTAAKRELCDMRTSPVLET